MKTTPYRTGVWDTNREWLFFSLFALSITLLMHAIANGWIGPWLGHNLYNDPQTAWIGTYPVDIMHFLAGFSIGAFVYNFNLGLSKRKFVLFAALATIVIVQNISLTWEFLEWLVYNRNVTGFIKTSLLDALWDQLMNVLGTSLAVLLGMRLG